MSCGPSTATSTKVSCRVVGSPLVGPFMFSRHRGFSKGRGFASDCMTRMLAAAVGQGTIGKLPRVSRPLTEKQVADWKLDRDGIRRRYKSRYGVLLLVSSRTSGGHDWLNTYIHV